MKTILMIIEHHTWMQKLPLRENMLICASCDAEMPMGKHWSGESCARRVAKKIGAPYFSHSG